MAATRSTSSERSGRPTFILMARKPLREIAVGLAQQRVERQVEVDAAGVAGHPRVDSRRAGSTAAGRARLALRSQSAMSKAESASTVGPPRPP